MFAIALWGIDKNGNFIGEDNLTGQGRSPYVLSLCLSKRRGPSVTALVKSELREVARQVRVEVSDLGFTDLSAREKTKRLLFLFQCDLLPGLSGQILSNKGSRDDLTSTRGPIAPWQKAAGYLTVLLIDAAMLFYVYLFALQQSKVRQVCTHTTYCVKVDAILHIT